MTGTASPSPRPWTSRYEFPGNRLYITDATGRYIAQVLRYPGQAAQEANAGLMAAAPDLLAALKTAQRFVGAYQLLLERGKNASDARFAGESFDECARAIAKAEGWEG